MSVDMPPELAWVARLAVGQSWPKGDEDGLQALGQAWHEAAQELKGISGQIGASGNAVLASVGGQVADEFRGFVTQLEASLPEMAESANQLGRLGKHTAVQVEYSKYMILGQLVLLAGQIAQWAFFAPEVIPVAVTGARLAVKMILRRLLISVATGVALNVGLDVAVQTIQFLKGDRTQWSRDNTVSAVVSGAVGGAMGGVFFGAGSVLAPKFAHSLLGKGVLGAATGLSTAGIMYGIYHSGENEFGSSISAGALGALGGGGKRRFGGTGDTAKIDPVHVNVPGALKIDLPGLPTAEKPELSRAGTFPGTFPGTSKNTATTAGTDNGGDGGDGGTGIGTFRGGNSAVVRETAGATSTPFAAHHDGGLPGFATTLTAAQGDPASTAAGGAATRSGTAVPAPARGTTGTTGTGSGAGAGATAANAGRPATTGGSGSTAPGPGRPATESTGAPRQSATGPGTTAGTPGTTEPTAPVRTESRPEATGTTEPAVGTAAQTATATTAAGTPTESTATPGRDATTANAGPHAATATGPHAATATEPHTTTAPRETAPVPAPRGETAAPGPGPTPPPGGPDQAPRTTLDRTPRFVVRSAFEARRFTYRSERVTDLTVRVAFRHGGDGHDTDGVWNRMSDGVRQFLNAPGYRLPNGDRLHVTVLRARPGEEPHLTVDLVGRDRAMDQRSWWPDAQPVDFAHEIGHQIGLRDEYRDRSTPHRPAVEGSLQGDYRAAAPEGLRQAGLRERHLHLIGTLVGDLGEGTGPRHAGEPAGRAPETAPTARPHDEVLAHDAEWARAWHGAESHDRRHVWVDPVSDPLGAGRAARPHADGGRAAPAVPPRMHQPERRPVYSPDNQLIMQPGYSSGDRFAILATLLDKPNMHVLIARGPGPGHPGHDPVLDKSRDIAEFYRDSGIDADRIWTLDLPNLEKRSTWRALNEEATRIAQHQWGINKYFGEMHQKRELWGVTHGTDHVAEHFSEGLRSKIRRAWQLEDHRDAEITDWLAGRGVRIPEGGGQVLVLWSRFTGKATKWAHLDGRMEHDTSFEGMRQLLRNLAGDYKAVIITGDPHPHPAKAGKWDELVREMRAELGNEHIHQITGFWRERDPRLSAWGGDTRTGQFRLYDHLNRRHGVQHLGFRSGNLEAVALIGHPVRYLEEGDATGARRMEAWHAALNERTRKGGLPPGYERTVVIDAATASGRYAKDFDKPELKGTYQPPGPDSPYRKPTEVYGRERGFAHADLENIRTALGLDGNRQGQEEFDTFRLHAVRRRYLKTAAEIRRLSAYHHHLGFDVEPHLAYYEGLLSHLPTVDQGGAVAMYQYVADQVLPQFPRLWQVRRTLEHAERHYGRWQGAQGGDEVLPRAPQSDGVVAQSDGTAMMTRPAQSSADGVPPAEDGASAVAATRAELSPDHPSLSAVPNTDGFAELRHLSSTGVPEDEARSSSTGVPEDQARSRYGMPAANFRKFRQIAAGHHLTIDVRPTNPTAVRWLEEGKLPKPKDIKAKSINDLDVLLGAKAEHRGLIGYFQPVRPERGTLDDTTWNRLQQRFAQRDEEFRTLAPVMARLQAEDRFKVQDGLVFGRDGEGNWREITGDHDVFDISTPGGTRLKGNRYEEVVGAMMANDMAVMHGAHMDWEPSTPFSKSIFTKIVESHREGGEPLLRFRSDVNDVELVHVPREFRFTGPAPVEKPAESAPTPLAHPESSAGRGEPSPTPAPPATALPEPHESPAVPPPGTAQVTAPEPRTAPADAVRSAAREPEPEPEPMTVEPDGDPETPRPPGGSPGRDGDAAPPEPGHHAAPSPEPPAGPAGKLGGRYQRSLAGIKITQAPGPEELRTRVLQTLPAGHREDRRVVQKLDVEFAPADFRARHEQMVNGGWRFRLWAGGAPHDVVLTARPGEWAPREERTPDGKNDGKGFERSIGAKGRAEPEKISLTTSKAPGELAPTVMLSVAGHDDVMPVLIPSVRASGATYATDTSVKADAETGAKTALTGPTRTYVSRFRYETAVIGPDGRPLPQPGSGPVHGRVTAEIAHPETDPAASRAGTWEGWQSDRPGPARGRPLDVTGLSALHADVFRRLPREGRPDGTAHLDILEFLSPKNVLDGFEHAAGWGLTSKRLDLSDGGHAWLRLTLEPETSVREGTVTAKDTFTGKETGEHAVGRTGTSTWGLGLNGGAARRVWHSGTTSESAWLTVTGGYAYAHSHAHQHKGKQTFTLENSLEHTGTGDLVTTKVRLRVEVLREHLSPRMDGLHAVGPEPGPDSPPARPAPDPEAAPLVHTGEVVRLRQHPDPASPTGNPAPHDAQGPGTRAAPADLRAPLTAQRTAFVEVPGSAELERHITERLRELAPGILPPPAGAEGRVTPRAMENQRLLRERLSPSALRAGGGRLLDGAFRITLDAPHSPVLPGRGYEVVIRADLGAGRHEGAPAATAKSTVTRGHVSEKAVTRGGKHTLSANGTFRRTLNPVDTVRVFGGGGADGSYSPSRQTVASAETQVQRAFQHKGRADAFSYPVTYRVEVGPHRPGDTPGARPAGSGARTATEVVPADGDRLRVEVRRSQDDPSAPRYLRPGRLPQLHSVAHVTDEALFRNQAHAALRSAYESRDPGSEPPRVPDLDEAVDALAGRAQLHGLVSASHSGWANTLDRHVGDGGERDTVGLSVRTRLGGLTYQETLAGDGTLELELKASGATTLADQTSWSAKGNLNADLGRFPETVTGALTTSYQVRGGPKVKLGGQRDDTETVKGQTGTARKVSHTGTWHVYRATAEISVAGRITRPDGEPHTGRPLRRDHEVFVLLSDEDVKRPHTASGGPTAATPPKLRATMLDQGISGGVLVDFPDSDLVLRAIDRQLRGTGRETVPVAALPFADTYSPDALAARYDELVGPGILDRHVRTTRSGHVVTEVLVRGIAAGWHDDGARSDRALTREVTASDTVKGKAAGKWSAGGEGNLRASLRPPTGHLDAASWTPSAAFEGSRGSGAESGVTATVGHRTSGFGDTNARFSTTMRFRVTVSRRAETGRFVNLPKPPQEVGPLAVTAWVPESLTERATAPEHPGMPQDPGLTAPLGVGPFGIELGRTDTQGHTARAAWQNALREAHDLVGFDNTRALHDAAIEVQATPRPWGDGLLGQTGAYSSWALNRGAGLARWAVRSALPEHLTGAVSRFLDSFAADPRLRTGQDLEQENAPGRENNPGQVPDPKLKHDLREEQRLTPEQRFAIRQAFSGQSLPALFHHFATRQSRYRVPSTSVALSIEAIGPAQEVGRRGAAEDELTVTVKDEAGTTLSDGYNWNVSPLDFSLLVDNPVLNFPLNTVRWGREQSYEPARPVTRAPGTPGRDTPDTALPHRMKATEPGKAEVGGPAVLRRQPVRIAVHGHDEQGGYAVHRTVTGHVFHWSRPSVTAPPSDRGSAHGPVGEPAAAPAPRPSGPAPSGSGPAPSAAGPSRSHAGEVAARAPRTGPLPAQAAAPMFTRSVAFAAEDATTPGPEESARIDALAAEVAREAVRRSGAGLALPEVLVTGHATASVSGRPHFGRAVQAGAERADAVREVFARRLDVHLRGLGSPLTSDAITIRAESRGSELPHGTDPAQDTPEARRQAFITVTRPPETGHEPAPRPDQPRTAS
ncbi:hypothetical protein [Streptomyces sp. NPDC020996]|uniref:WXG100-like domain-containing protein n=1 Tax=Streptomyces sp. NPDC020996 TaxID=3154791 RepID=UPI003407DD9E